jgi:protein associated with RNAse G/E
MSESTHLQIGSQVQVRAYKSDGTCYRWWMGTVEAVEPECVVVITPVGHRVHTPDGGGRSRWAIRATYWSDRWYSVLELYLPDGTLVEIYVNINSPVEIGEGTLSFTDYELDVSRELPHRARLVDEDEFQEAVSLYGYSAEFQQTCYRVAQGAIDLADTWVAKGMPTVDPQSHGKDLETHATHPRRPTCAAPDRPRRQDRPGPPDRQPQ